MSKKVDELSVSLRLDTDEWEKDYQNANRKVRAASKELTNANKQNKVKLQLETLGADAAAGKLSSLTRQMGILTDMVGNQRAKVLLAQNAYTGLVAAASNQKAVLDVTEKTSTAYKGLAARYAATKAASVSMNTQLGREQIALARLEKQVLATSVASSAAYKAMATNALAFVSKVSLGLAVVGGIAVKMAMAYENEEKRVKIAFGSSAQEMNDWSVEAAKGLGTASDGLVVFDDNLRLMSSNFFVMLDNLGLTRDKSFELAKGLSVLSFNLGALQGRDPDEVFQKLRDGMAGRTQGLKDLNIIIKDSDLLEFAYQNGIAKTGTALDKQQKALATYGMIQKQTAYATDYMAKNTDDAAVKQMRLKAATEDMSKALGKDLMPAYKDLLGMLSKVVAAYNDMNDAAEGSAARLVKTGIDLKVLSMLPLPWWIKAPAAISVGIYEGIDYYKDRMQATEIKASAALNGRAPDSNNAKLRNDPDTGNLQKEILDKVKESDPDSAAFTRWVDLQGEELERAKQQISDFKNGVNQEDSKDTELQMAEQEKETAKAIENAKADAETQKAITNEIYKLTHNELEQELKDIDEKAKEYRDKKVDEVTVTAYVEAAKGKILDDYQNDTLSKIKEVTQTELEIKLAAIEQEKEAYKKKGLAEVEATKWAEEEKRKVIQNVAMEAIKNDRKRLEDIREAMSAATSMTYTDKNGETVTKQFSTQDKLDRIAQQMMQEQRKKLGIDDGDTFSPELINMYSKIKDSAENNLIPGLQRNPQFDTQGMSGRNVTPVISITIANPTVLNNNALVDLADKVAGYIEPALDKALKGNGQNKY